MRPLRRLRRLVPVLLLCAALLAAALPAAPAHASTISGQNCSSFWWQGNESWMVICQHIETFPEGKRAYTQFIQNNAGAYNYEITDLMSFDGTLLGSKYTHETGVTGTQVAVSYLACPGGGPWGPAPVRAHGHSIAVRLVATGQLLSNLHVDSDLLTGSCS